MSEPCVFTNSLVVQTLDCNFSDERVCVAARTSTAGMIANPKATAGLINSLMRNRHGSPFEQYERLLAAGIMREVARMVLPVNIMSTCVVTMNARALMNFLSLRVNSEDSTYPSKPMREIQMVAEKYEETFKFFAPITHAAFVSGGRVAP